MCTWRRSPSLNKWAAEGPACGRGCFSFHPRTGSRKSRSENAHPLTGQDAVRLGGLPTPSVELKNSESRSIWFDGYVRTYLERDLQDLAAIENLVDFRRLMRAASYRLGGLANYTELSRDIGVPRTTVRRYLSLLETSFQVTRLEPYSVNRTKRLIKSPKLYWGDTGLALHLAGDAEPTGAHLENLILNDLLAWMEGTLPRAEVLFWRTATDQEVDLVVEVQGRLLAIEVKTSHQIRNRDIRHLVAFGEEYGTDFHGGLLLHGGDEVSWLAKGVPAAPWWKVL